MHAAKQAAWLFTVLILLACSGWYFARTPQVQKLDAETLSMTADTLIHQLSVRQFDQQGRLSHRLNTPFLQHIPQNNTHLLQTPKILVVQEQQAPFEISSEEAVAIHGGEQISFLKKVVVHQDKNKSASESTMRTEKLIYFPKMKKATTEVLVTFEQTGTQIQSTGMNAYLAEKRVELLHQAKGRYEPSHG